MSSRPPNPPTFQDLILRLQTFWADQGCVLQQPYDIEVGAGTMAPETFLRVLGSNPYKVAYVQPSRRPADGRYGENPNRLYKHTQLQVILKPPPENVQELYLESLGAMGIDLRQHDIKFEEDNWEAPTLSAWGVGWQVMLDGLEITQFTYFQQCGGIDLDPISAELTYGLERIAAFLQDVDSIYDILWARDPETGKTTTYGDVRLADELQFSVYNFEVADVEKTWKHFELCAEECKRLIRVSPGAEYEANPTSIRWSWPDLVLRTVSNRYFNIPAGCYLESGLSPGQEYRFRFVTNTDGSVRLQRYQDINEDIPNSLPFVVEGRTSQKDVERGTARIDGGQYRLDLALPALDLCLKCSHLFNILDARGAISVTERVGVIARVRALAVGIARAYVDQPRGDAAAPEEEREKPRAKKKLDFVPTVS